MGIYWITAEDLHRGSQEFKGGWADMQKFCQEKSQNHRWASFEVFIRNAKEPQITLWFKDGKLNSAVLK